MAECELRPMSTGELLDRSFRLYRGHFWLFAALLAWLAMVECGLSILVHLVARLGGGGRTIGVALTAMVVQVSQAYVYWLAAGITVLAAGSLCLGRRDSIRVIHARFWMRAASLTLLLLMLGVVMIGGMIAVVMLMLAADPLLKAAGATAAMVKAAPVLISTVLVTAGTLFLALRYGVALPVLLFEDLGVSETLRRSARLTRGHRGRVFVILVLMVVISLAAAVIFEGPIAAMGLVVGGPESLPFWAIVLAAVASSLGSLVSWPLPMIALTLLYYDIRVRTEGFDLQLMISDLRRPAPSAGTLSLHRGP